MGQAKPYACFILKIMLIFHDDDDGSDITEMLCHENCDPCSPEFLFLNPHLKLIPPVISPPSSESQALPAAAAGDHDISESHTFPQILRPWDAADSDALGYTPTRYCDRPPTAGWTIRLQTQVSGFSMS